MLASYFYVESAAYYRSSTLQEIWAHSWSNASIIIPRICDILLLILNFIHVTRDLTLNLESFITYIVPDIEPYYSDPFFLATILFIVFLVPLIYVQSVRTISVIYIVKNFCFNLLVIMVVIRSFMRPLKESPNLCSFKYVDGLSLYNFISSFTIHPLGYPGLRQVSRATESQLIKICMRLMITIFILELIVGEAILFSYPLENILDQKLSFNMYTVNIISYVLQLILQTISLIVILNPLRYFCINILYQSDNIPIILWAWCGFIFAAAGAYFAFLHRFIESVFQVLRNIMMPIVNFVIPSVLYLKTFGFRSKIAGSGAVALIVISFAMIILLNVL